MISKSTSEGNTTVKISKERDNGLTLVAKREGKMKKALLDQVLEQAGFEELTNEQLEERLTAPVRRSAMVITR